MVPIHNGILLRHKKEQHDAICSNLNGSRDSHTKFSTSEGERQIPYDITYVWNLKYGTNEPIWKTETDSQTCGCQGGGGGNWVDWEFGVSRCKLLPLKWISSEVLLNSIENYIQSLVMEHDGRYYEKKESIYICITGSLCCT